MVAIGTPTALLLAALALSAPARGDAADGDTAVPAAAPAPAPEVEDDVDVVVSAQREPTRLSRTPAAVSVVDVPGELAGRVAVGLEEALAFVPGLAARGATNFAQDLRLSVRGFGARAAFGIRGLTLLVDGFPETMPDGQAQVDSIDVAAVERAEVLRGLASSLYGNAAGGVVRLDTLRPTPERELTVRASGGERGLGKLAASTAGYAGALGYALTVSTLRTDGWRRRAAAEQTIGNVNVTARAGRGELLVSLALADAPVADDPGGLTAAEVRADRRQPSSLSTRFATGEAVRHARLGASWRGSLARDHALEVLAWGARRTLESAIPFTFIDLHRTAGGAGARWSWSHRIRGAEARLGAAIEAQTQRDDRENFANVGGAPSGPATLAQDETVDAGGLSLQEEITLRDVTLAGGVRFDVSRYGARDRRLDDGDASGSRTFRQPTARAGAVWSPSPLLSVYGSVSQAFEAPTTTELVNLSRGGFDPDLEPQRALGLEAGVRGRRAGAGIASWDVAVFHARISDGFVRQEDENARAFYVNAARSTHRGAEASVGARAPGGVQARATYTLVDARFDAYAPRGAELAGRRVPGIPRHAAAAELAWSGRGLPFVAAVARTGGGWHADDENRTFERVAWALDLRAAWPLRAGRALVTPFLACENVTSARYSDSLRINAAGARYFEPAPPLQVRGGISVEVR